jgi:hypothetical protein
MFELIRLIFKDKFGLFLDTNESVQIFCSVNRVVALSSIGSFKVGERKGKGERQERGEDFAEHRELNIIIKLSLLLYFNLQQHHSNN